MAEQDSVTPNARIMADMESCAKCCKFCREQENIVRLLQAEPNETASMLPPVSRPNFSLLPRKP
jgi:hypothetical protein